ncbi:unnamed protein product [Phyllotreta striolata]|uniref:palmitoyl-protein hydrolase n=1 Tax=Phyllotreta striolata TaxID=444603 RepID=A0A9N9TQ89_PHYSR|nr:unnamed protein product [Phyllotreta striolata]
MSLGPLHIVKQRNVCQAAVIFLHGSGDTGQGVLDWIKFLIGDFSLPHIKFYFPTAPSRPYTPLNGQISNVWFNRYDVNPFVPEHDETLNSIGKEMQEFLEKVKRDNNISLNKIVIGGFSMGGALALHTAYRFSPGLAGVFTLSSFLNENSAVYQEAKGLNAPLYMCHGDRDTMVPIQWGQTTETNLKKLGANVQFTAIRNCMHELKKSEVVHLFEWIQKVLPESEVEKN